MKSLNSTSLLAFCLLNVFLIINSSSVFSQDVYFDNQTNCSFTIGLSDLGCSYNGLTDGPYDVPSNEQHDYPLSWESIGTGGSVNRLFIHDGSASELIPICPPPSFYQCMSITCSSSPVIITWTVSGSDIYITISI